MYITNPTTCITMGSKSVKIDILEKENSDLKLKVSSVMGKSLRLECKLERTKKRIIEMEYREMRQNLVFYNVDENISENPKELMTSVLQTNFGVSCETSNSEQSQHNAEIDVAHRIGTKISGKTRPMVVRFTTRKWKELVLAKSRTTKTSIKVSEQYPSEMKERRNAQLDSLKAYRDIHKDKGTKVTLVKDKLFVGKQVVGTNFENNKLQPLPTDSVRPLKTITQTPVQEYNKSYFQGHAARVSSIKQAAAIKQALYQSSHNANSDHLIYAYAVTDESGMKITGNSDDGEWTASRLLLDLISHKMETNIFIAVSRQHQGPNLGRKRLSIISAIAEDALLLLNKDSE